MCIASGTNASLPALHRPYPVALGLRRNAISMFSAESPPLPKLASARRSASRQECSTETGCGNAPSPSRPPPRKRPRSASVRCGRRLLVRERALDLKRSIVPVISSGRCAFRLADAQLDQEAASLKSGNPPRFFQRGPKSAVGKLRRQFRIAPSAEKATKFHSLDLYRAGRLIRRGRPYPGIQSLASSSLFW